MPEHILSLSYGKRQPCLPGSHRATGVAAMTNGDKIRSMTDEELQKWLCSIMTAECCDMSCPGRDMCMLGHNGLYDWLKQEVQK